MALDTTLAIEVDDSAVEFTLAVTNTGEEAEPLQFPSGRTAEFTVRDDNVVWRSSDGKLFTKAERSERLDAGETLTETATWDEPPAGTYTVEAALDTTDVDLAVEESFEV